MPSRIPRSSIRRSAGEPASGGNASGGKGMPAKTARAQSPTPQPPASPRDQASEASLELPHERDQAVDMTAPAPDPNVAQAARDLEQGKQDTSKGPEMDRTYRQLKR